MFVATRLGTSRSWGRTLRVYREAWKAAGHPGNGKVFLRVPVYVAATEAQALSEPEESVMYFYRYLGERIEESATPGRRPRDREPRGARPAAADISWDEACATRSSSARRRGDGPAVALQEELGLDGILAEMNCGMRIPQRAGAELAAAACAKRSSRRFTEPAGAAECERFGERRYRSLAPGGVAAPQSISTRAEDRKTADRASLDRPDCASQSGCSRQLCSPP